MEEQRTTEEHMATPSSLRALGGRIVMRVMQPIANLPVLRDVFELQGEFAQTDREAARRG
jgi:hypothetical protein